MDENEFKNTYGLDPIKMIDLKSLMGDASDNIPGVKGIGEKTAIKLLQEYGSLDNIYHNIDSIKGSVHDKLLNDKDNAYMSYDLATIYSKVPIDTNLETIKKLAVDNDTYSNLLKELEFFSLLKKIENNETKEEIKTNEVIVIDDLSKLELEDEYSIYLEVLGYNYHDAKPLGISIYSKNKAYYIPFNLLINSSIFSDNKKKYTYDLKKLLVVFDKYDIKIDKNIRSHNKFSKDNIMNKIRTHFFH